MIVGLLGSLTLFGQETVPRVMVAPEYSGVAIGAGVSGQVTIEIQVEPTGAVRLLQVQGHPLLRQKSQDAAKKWIFETGAAGRKQVITFIFRLLPAKGVEEDEVRFLSPLTIEVSKRLPDVQPLPGEKARKPGNP